jgi:hypothetical protein
VVGRVGGWPGEKPKQQRKSLWQAMGNFVLGLVVYLVSPPLQARAAARVRVCECSQQQQQPQQQ